MPEIKNHALARDQQMAVLHTGGAAGASSVLLILPRREDSTNKTQQSSKALPDGVVVAILCNMHGVGMRDLAYDIAQEFQTLKTDAYHRVQKVYQC